MFSIERVFFCFLVFFSLASCQGQDPNPELRDPIYKDLSHLAKEYDKKLKDALKVQENNFKELSKAGADKMSLKVARKKIANNNKKIIQHRQMASYYRIRSERRKVEGRRAYKIAFRKKQNWPNPKEYQNYLVNKRLRQAHRNWSTRVPKMVDRYTSSLPQ